ncbi:unnamed protein product [Durusdinium trenchii]|uniref:Synaptic functional regulator FMR1 (Fragile X mental retardation protein 1 homolog) (FMRP) (Protein FMR-1) (XtFmrp) n=2 Tax=Durusdinium trenchii TaxID=1381693 RepID=A0ABP0M318_9DINO
MFDTVEVRWPSHPFLWHRARLWDLHEVPGSGTCVACDTGDRSLTQPSFPVQDVRLPPPADADLTGFDPQPGELVEYEVLPTDTTPAGWAVAQVVAVSGRFWQLRWPERWGERMGEVLMPLSRLRPCVSPKGNVENLLRKEEVVVDRELLAEDTSSCFRRVESLAVGLQAQETTELLRIRKVTLEPKILAIGTVKAVQRAKILIPSMLHNHRKANNLQEATKKREQALAMRSMKKLRDAWNPKEVPDSLVKDEFMMDSLHVGRLIGKGGSNIRALQNELDVKICIFDKDEKKKSIVVLGPDKDKVFEVRKNSQILRQRRKLDPEMKKWVTSRITLLEMIQKMCGLNSIHLEGQNISLTGTKEACEQGLKFLDAQLQYFMILKELEKVKNGYAQRAQDDNQIVWPPRPQTPRLKRSQSHQKIWL